MRAKMVAYNQIRRTPKSQPKHKEPQMDTDQTTEEEEVVSDTMLITLEEVEATLLDSGLERLFAPESGRR
jgi:hypothetical protein